MSLFWGAGTPPVFATPKGATLVYGLVLRPSQVALQAPSVLSMNHTMPTMLKLAIDAARLHQRNSAGSVAKACTSAPAAALAERVNSEAW